MTILNLVASTAKNVHRSGAHSLPAVLEMRADGHAVRCRRSEEIAGRAVPVSSESQHPAHGPSAR